MNMRVAKVGMDWYKKTQNWVCRKGEVDLGRAVGEGEYVQKMLHEVLKEIIIKKKNLKEYCSLRQVGNLYYFQEGTTSDSSIPGPVWWDSLISWNSDINVNYLKFKIWELSLFTPK